MTAKKKVAKTLLNVMDHEVMMGIMDRQFHPDAVVSDVQSWWGFDMYKRKPGPALINDVFEGTDLDLACFMSALAERGAVINIPWYKSMRPQTIKEGQRVVSKDNRHGPIINLTSNKDLFSFGVKIMDANVIGTDSVGDFRTFSITDPSGEMYEGWRTIEFDPVAKENKFLTENDIWTGNRVIFKNFVHPNRWISFYGVHYFITKCLIERLRDQAKNYHSQINRMLDNGIKYPVSGEGAQTKWAKQTKEKGKSVKFRALEVECDIPEYYNEYPTFKDTQENLVYLTKERKNWAYKVVPALSFAVRCTELAHLKYGFNGSGKEKMPAWLNNVKWEEGYKQKGKRIEWNRLTLFQPGVGERAVAIRKRVKEKSEIMSLEYSGGIK